MKSHPRLSKKRIVPIFILLVLFAAPAALPADPIQKDVPALKDVFAKDFTIGCLLSYTHIGLPDDPPVAGQAIVSAPEGGYLIQYHMNCMSPGNMMKPVLTVDTNASAAAVKAAAPDKLEFAETHPVVKFNPNLVAQLNWAKRRGFAFRGHTLVWHAQTPSELFTVGYRPGGERVTKEVMLKRMEHYIGDVIRLLHEGWPGMVTAMDVVNEAVGDTGNVRNMKNDWYTTFGDESYIRLAFEFARKYAKKYGEKQMKLYYNDYGTSNPAKADGIVRLLTPIFKAGFLDGIGMQEHDAVGSPPAEAWVASYDKFNPICREMAVTELDVNAGSPEPPADVLQAQANQYAALFKAFLERSARSGRGKIVNVSKDGLNDHFTFRPNQSSSLWDKNNRCKPAFYAVVDTAKNYKELSALIAGAAKLSRKKFTADEWKAIPDAVKAAKEALNKNYTADESAVKGLGDAIENLKQALKVD